LTDIADKDLFSMASAMLIDGAEGPDEILALLSPLQRDIISMQQLLVDGKLADATTISEELLSRSRSNSERDAEAEVRIRIERALLAVEGNDKSGMELRWCTDRLNAMMPGSSLHGIAMLNLAAWHANNGEIMMSLAIHADISKISGHPPEIRGLSRLEVARMLSALSDYDPAMRHLWTARAIFLEYELTAEAIVAGLEWLDLALEEVDSTAPRMLERIESAAPRPVPGNSWIPSNPEDVRDVVEYLLPILTVDVTGAERNDLGLIVDAAEVIGEGTWLKKISEHSGSIQDTKLLEALQS
jgi:hypothetical protein|tara:strand:+ start:2252 stop:3151 length:900 start_codon:yes stop_codon:yes gene_type:complete